MYPLSSDRISIMVIIILIIASMVFGFSVRSFFATREKNKMIEEFAQKIGQCSDLLDYTQKQTHEAKEQVIAAQREAERWSEYAADGCRGK